MSKQIFALRSVEVVEDMDAGEARYRVITHFGDYVTSSYRQKDFFYTRSAAIRAAERYQKKVDQNNRPVALR